jgi:DNA-binding CsgD family transcriptional regulator
MAGGRDLTDREQALMDLVCDTDLSREQMGDRLGISEHTVKVHLDAARTKYRARTLTRAAAIHARRRNARRSRLRRSSGQLGVWA